MRQPRLTLACGVVIVALMAVATVPAVGQTAAAPKGEIPLQCDGNAPAELCAQAKKIVEKDFTQCNDRLFYGFVELPGPESCVGITGPQERASVRKCEAVFEFGEAHLKAVDTSKPADKWDKRLIGIIRMDYQALRVRRVTNDVWGKWEPAQNRPVDADSSYFYRFWKQDGTWSQENGTAYSKLALLVPNDLIEHKPSCADILKDEGHTGEPPRR